MESLHKFIHGAQPSMTCESPQGPQGSGPAVFFFLGKGIGFVNTPVARSVAMALSRFYINRIGQQGEVQPSFRQASEFDIFRGQSGQVSRLNTRHHTLLVYSILVTLKLFPPVCPANSKILRPDIFDDGTLPEQPFKKLKAVTDVGNIESMSKERWGAAKRVKGQPRIYCVNDYDAQGGAPKRPPHPILSSRHHLLCRAR